MCPHESGSRSQDGALTVGLQVQRQGCHGNPWGHPRAAACGVGQLLFWRSLFLLRRRGLQMLHEFSVSIASQGFKNIYPQICGLWDSPRQPWSPSGQVASISITTYP